MKIIGNISNETSQITITASTDWWKEIAPYTSKSTFNIWSTSELTREELLRGDTPSAELFIGIYEHNIDFLMKALEVLSYDGQLTGTLILNREFLQKIFDEHKNLNNHEWNFFITWCKNQPLKIE